MKIITREVNITRNNIFYRKDNIGLSWYWAETRATPITPPQKIQD